MGILEAEEGGVGDGDMWRGKGTDGATSLHWRRERALDTVSMQGRRHQITRCSLGLCSAGIVYF